MALQQQVTDIVDLLDTLSDKITAIQKPADPDLTPIAEAVKAVAEAVSALEKRLTPVEAPPAPTV